MFITKVEIKYIRSISNFEMKFDSAAGWHVLIGDNGSGKSSIIRAIALALVGQNDAQALSSFEDFSNWLPPGEKKGNISIDVSRDNEYDKPKYTMKKDPIANSNISLERVSGNGKVKIIGKVTPDNALWGKHANSGWFAAAYGPFRRLRGGVEVFAHLISSRPRLASCLTAFRDDVALTQLISWLKDLALDAPKKTTAKSTLESIIAFVNIAKLLPDNAVLLDDIDSDGIKLKDPNGVSVSLYEMSDGYRSVLSMTLDIIRFLIETYGPERVFEKREQGVIDLPGVVLIDEVDAHLHPSWQSKIGHWFTKYFPNIQFIVTTLSPLVCRACENGTIWRLAASGTSQVSGEISGFEKEKLIFGNILDAYGTEVFGKSPVRSQKSDEKLQRLGKLNMLSALGKISEEDENERLKLQQILSSDAPTGK